MIPGTGRRGACCPATRLNNDAVANPLQGLANRKTRKPYRTAMPRKIIVVRWCKSDHACVNMRTRRSRAIAKHARRWRFVVAGLVPAIHALPHGTKNVDARGKPRDDDALVHDGRHAKLLRGQAMPDMRDSIGKVAEYCAESRRETPEFVNFS